MFENYKDSHQEFRDYDSDLLFKFLNKTLIEPKNIDDKIPSDNSNLKRILSDIFPNKKIVVQDNNDGSQTIFLS